MTLLLFVEQFLNGMQFGVFLFLISAGLTLVLGIMNVVNLAHGSLYGSYIRELVEEHEIAMKLAKDEELARADERAAEPEAVGAADAAHVGARAPAAPTRCTM